MKRAAVYAQIPAGSTAGNPQVWYRQDALDMRAVGRFLKGCEPEEGADGGQAHIATAW